MKDKHHSSLCYQHPWTLSISFLLLARIYKLGIQSYISHKLSDKTYGSKCLTICSWIWKSFNNQTQITVPKPQGNCFSHFMKNKCKISIPNPQVCLHVAYLNKIFFNFLQESHSNKYNLTTIREWSTITPHLGNVSKQLPFFGE